MARLPQFVWLKDSKWDELQNFITNGTIKFPTYIWDDVTNKWYFLKSDKTLAAVVGNNEKQVMKVDSLPASGKEETLYIMNRTVYMYDTEDKTFYPLYQELINTVTAVERDVGSIKESLSNVMGSVEDLQETVQNLGSEVNDLKDNVENLQTGFDDGLSITII